MSSSKPTKQQSDPETSDPGYRSRSQSRRSRRRKQQSQQSSSQAEAKSKQSLPPLEEESQAAESQASAGAMQPFEHIGPDETSMDGPVTLARAQRGEIPMRDGNPNQQLKTGPKGGGGEESKMMEQDGLKLRLELNLDVEIELKASIHGDLTLALL
ncbi:hypothetical protein MMC07_007458 [Pseudocyphellaria aurata]|nr:hypothetical protein [Pseudocyphellaria aurata]